MKKLFNILVLFLISIIFQDAIYAASISLGYDGFPFVKGNKTDDELIFWVKKIQNNTDKPVVLKLKYEFIYLTKGHSIGVCFDNNCYKSTNKDWMAPDTILIEPNGAKTGLGNSFHLYPFDLDLGPDPVAIDGNDTIKFTLFNVNDPTDFASITVAFQVGDPTSIVEDGKIGEFEITDIFPNPAVENTKIDYTLPEKLDGDPFLEVYNPLGERILLKNICDCKYTVDLDLNGYSSGTYYCNLFMNGKKTKSKNLIIKK